MHAFTIMMIALPVLFFGCKKDEMSAGVKDTGAIIENQLKTDIAYCGTPLVAPMVNFTQTINPGTVTIGNDTSTLFVTYQLTGSWRIYQAVLFVGPAANAPGTLNPDGTGVFNLGAFPIQSPYYGSFRQTHTFSVNLNTLDDCFVVVAALKVKDTITNETKEIWGKPLMKSSGYHFNYCVQTCTPPPPPPPPTPLGGCETAYAFGNNLATCFLDIPGVNSNNWGWSNGPIGAGSYSWPIYAGAGQCNTDNGTHVGTLQVSYTPPTATVTYTMFDGYVLNATHLYVGNQILPTKNGRYTTAPGQFPYKHVNLGGAGSDSYTITGLSGNIYVAAHSEACDDIE